MSGHLARVPQPAFRDATGLREALRLLYRAERRKPTEDDAPPCSTLPSTRASREALRLDRGGPPALTKKRRRDLTYGEGA